MERIAASARPPAVTPSATLAKPALRALRTVALAPAVATACARLLPESLVPLANRIVVRVLRCVVMARARAASLAALALVIVVRVLRCAVMGCANLLLKLP